MGRWSAVACRSGRSFSSSPVRWAPRRPSRASWPPLARFPLRLFAARFLPSNCRRIAVCRPISSSEAVFARTYGFSLGRSRARIRTRWPRASGSLFGHRPWHRIHVWQRDAAAPGEHGFEPPDAAAASGLRGHSAELPSARAASGGRRPPMAPAGRGRGMGDGLHPAGPGTMVGRLPSGQVGAVAVAGRADAAWSCRRMRSAGRG